MIEEDGYAGKLYASADPGAPDAQFIQFLLIGCLNITMGYGLFAAFIILSLPTALALLLSTVVGVLFNYCSSGRLVFSWRTSNRLWLFVLSHTVIYSLNIAALLWLERMSIPVLVAQAFVLPLIVVLAFLFNKCFVFSPPRTVRS
jgi:putative flippase GtrA